MTSPSGRLAIWNKCTPGMEAEYEAWYQTEHLMERLSIPGFRRGRRYASIDRGNGYFTYYETDSPDVLNSAAYLERVNNPTPMTRDIMNRAFIDMSRTVCERVFAIGRMRGGFAATLMVSDVPTEIGLKDWLASGTRASSIARIEAWKAVGEPSPDSTESRLRGGDKRIDACLLVEMLRREDCATVLDDLVRDLGVSDTATGTYRLLCELTSDRLR